MAGDVPALDVASAAGAVSASAHVSSPTHGGDVSPHSSVGGSSDSDGEGAHSMVRPATLPGRKSLANAAPAAEAMAAAAAAAAKAPAATATDDAQQKKAPVRENGSFVHVHEQKLLNWLVRRLPAWVTPDHLTAVGVLGMALAGLGVVLFNTHHEAWIHLSSFGLALNWYGDSLDGHCARYRDLSRPNYGFFVDIMADLLGVGLWLVVGMGASGLAPAWMPVTVYSLFLVIVLLDLFSIALAREEHRVDAAGVSGTEVRMVVIVLHCVMHTVGAAVGATLIQYALAAFAVFGVVFIGYRSSVFGKQLLERDNAALRARGKLPPVVVEA